MINFSGKVVFITGASGGIGSQITRDFAKHGAHVVIHDFGMQKAALALQAEVEQSGIQSLLVEGDLTCPETVQKIVAQIEEKFDRIDVLVNNAGASPNKMPLRELSAEAWDKVININLRSVFLVTQSALPLLKKSENGRIINISSTAARNGGAVGGAAYSAAKGAVISLTKNFAKDFSADGIQVNAVAPGLIDTAFYGDINVADKYAERIKTIPLGRVGQPSDIAGPVLFLASSLANYITGEVIEVSGGLPLMG
jgi:3-oxoacyl-[acyl-carrier protein] reductase